ncbi:MAG: hypothetical protein A3A58_01830 [Candidatus Blackburnbacteria bacterium RIFCSPLOWO2_01_FULL_41_27]|uniref:Uncharacterized protein n=1 Tax=Candidatus Blackburnbacteria bacterium RIFCSPLOWO2_01_FULL_41_27 TaxID=1797520 RepID=A0A1G1VGH5_9BACT|nr:MAG: hypothetical protein A3A58_01830 [Candidatus Blackburnbacteria bacterium RIFCSPLOWO2_01_FULL_41_27]
MSVETLLEYSKGAPIEEIKGELQTRASHVPFQTLLRFFPDDLQIPLTEGMRSQLLPLESCHVDEDGNRYTLGHDVVKTFLARNGKVIAKLVHYDSDDYDAKKRWPDEILGEVDDETYREAYLVAIVKLDILLKK